MTYTEAVKIYVAIKEKLLKATPNSPVYAQLQKELSFAARQLKETEDQRMPHDL